MAESDELAQNVVASGKTRAQNFMRHPVVDIEYAQAASVDRYARAQICGEPGA